MEDRPHPRATVQQWQQRLGQEIRRLRLDANRTQAEVAAEANINPSTLQRMERGEGGTLGSFIQVARALGREHWLASFAPAPSVSPMQRLRERERTEAVRRQRARPRGRSRGL